MSDDGNKRAKIREMVKAEGIEIMIDVYDIIMDRDEANPDQILARLEDEENHSAFLDYETFIVPGINYLSDVLAGVYDDKEVTK